MTMTLQVAISSERSGKDKVSALLGESCSDREKSRKDLVPENEHEMQVSVVFLARSAAVVRSGVVSRVFLPCELLELKYRLCGDC